MKTTAARGVHHTRVTMARPTNITSGSGDLDSDDRDDGFVAVPLVDISEADLVRAEEGLRIAEELRMATLRYERLATRTRSVAAWAAMRTRLSMARYDALAAGVIRKRLDDGSPSEAYVRLSTRLADVARRLSTARGSIQASQGMKT